MELVGIYKFIEKNTGKVYIGQSENIWERYGFHYTTAFSKKEGISNFDLALRNNPTNFEFAIIELCDKKDLDSRENYWIKYYNSIENGYNTISKRLVYQFTKDGILVGTYQGYSDAAKAIGIDNAKGNIYKCCMGKIKTAYGYIWSFIPDFTKETSSSSDLPKPREEFHSTKPREVLQLDENGNILARFSSVSSAAKAVNVTGSAISQACNGRTKRCKGYYWKYYCEEWCSSNEINTK